MKINSETALVGNNVVLVPYRQEHVPRYHNWMQCPDLLAQTASEQLTLEQEYQMQQSWYRDENKCTFIILDKRKWQQSGMTEVESMVGDVNLFFNDEDEPHTAEIEIMIAESSSRGGGLGKEALLLMMNYGVSSIAVHRFVAKIGLDNTPSLALFKKLGYTEVSVSEVFEEVTLELKVAEVIQEFLQDATAHVRIHKYMYPLEPHTTESTQTMSERGEGSTQ